MELIKWDEISHQIATETDINKLSALRNKLTAIKEMAKQSKQSLETQNKISEYRIRVDRKLGAWGLALEKSPGKRTDLTLPEPFEVKSEVLKDIGISRGEMTRKELTAEMPKKEFEKYITEIQDDNKELTSAGVQKESRKIKKAAEIEELKTAPVKPPKLAGYDVIVIDPPWQDNCHVFLWTTCAGNKKYFNKVRESICEAGGVGG
jgi:hypothetical protein